MKRRTATFDTEIVRATVAGLRTALPHLLQKSRRYIAPGEPRGECIVGPPMRAVDCTCRK